MSSAEKSSRESLFPCDLTDEQWDLIRNYFPSARGGGRPRTTDLRQVINAIFYICRTGCAWRYLPKCFPPWQTVYDYFAQFRRKGIWREIHESLIARVRTQRGRELNPAVLVIDTQSVRAPLGEDRGFDGYKNVRGRKRHILVDTMGLIHSLRVHAANLRDQQEGHTLFDRCRKGRLSRMERLYADHGYRGLFARETRNRFGYSPVLPELTASQGRLKTQKEKRERRKLRGLRPPPKKRWIVERTFAWFNHYRRLSKDYEKKTTQSESMIYVAMSQLLLRRKILEVTP